MGSADVSKSEAPGGAVLEAYPAPPARQPSGPLGASGSSTPAALADFLAATDVARRAEVVGDMQRTVGNCAVTRFLSRAAAPAGATESANGDARESANAEWHLELTPAAGVITTKTWFDVRLKASEERRSLFFWGNAPMLHILRDGKPLGEPLPMFGEQGPPIDTRATPTRRLVRIAEPGPVELVAVGTPREDQPLSIAYPPVRVSVRLDVVGDATDEALAQSGTGVAEDERRRIADPNAPLGEIGQAFARAAQRRAIEIVNHNRAEALALQKQLVDDTTGKAAADAAALVLDADAEIERWRDQRIAEVEKAARRAVPGAPSLDEMAAKLEDDVETVLAVRTAIMGASPLAGLLHQRDEAKEDFEKAGAANRLAVLRKVVADVIADCEKTRTALATDDLDPLASPHLVQDARRAFGVDQDARRTEAVEQLLAQRRAKALNDAIGLAGISLLLMLVPGIGQVLALAAGAAGAAMSWEDVQDLQRAANAGLVPQAEADDRQFWATVESVLVGIQAIGPVAKALSKLSKLPVGRGALAMLRSLLPRLARAAGTAMTDEQLIARSKELFEQVVALVRGSKVNPGALKGQITVAVLQGSRDGKLVTLVSVNDPKYMAALRKLLSGGEELVESTVAFEISAKTGNVLKSGINLHAEQVLAVEATKRGLTMSRVATSNPGCQPLCISLLSDLYPEIVHVNPAKVKTPLKP